MIFISRWINRSAGRSLQVAGAVFSMICVLTGATFAEEGSSKSTEIKPSSANPVQLFSYSEALERLRTHPKLGELHAKSKGLEAMSARQGSWGDPLFKIQAKNFPKDSLRDDLTPMTGIEYSITQTIPLGPQFSAASQAQKRFAEAQAYQVDWFLQKHRQNLWQIAIEQRLVEQEIEIFSESLAWVTDMLRVSEKLYSNGRLSQQALLNLQVQKTDWSLKKAAKGDELEQLKADLRYLVGDPHGPSVSLQVDSFPWQALREWAPKSQLQDFQEKHLAKRLEGQRQQLRSKRWSFAPELQIGISYTQRADIDNHGDFVGAGVGFKVPLSSSKYAAYREASHGVVEATRSLESYELAKQKDLQRLSLQEKILERERKTLKDKSIRYAKTARDLTAKNYALGKVSYTDLIQAELQYQSLLLRRHRVEAKFDKVHVQRRIIRGENLGKDI